MMRIEGGAAIPGDQLITAAALVEPSRPVLASDDLGNVAIAWRAANDQRDRFWSWYTVVSNGRAAARRTLLAGHNADRPAISGAGEHFVITWESEYQGTLDINLQLFRFDDGVRASPITRVNQHKSGAQSRAHVTSVASEYGVVSVVGWEAGNHQDGDGRGIFGRVFLW